jgi:hypothetical protein
MSTYKGEHTIFGLLGQANLTQNDVLQFHPFTSAVLSINFALAFLLTTGPASPGPELGISNPASGQGERKQE